MSKRGSFDLERGITFSRRNTRSSPPHTSTRGTRSILQPPSTITQTSPTQLSQTSDILPNQNAPLQNTYTEAVSHNNFGTFNMSDSSNNTPAGLNAVGAVPPHRVIEPRMARVIHATVPNIRTVTNATPTCTDPHLNLFPLHSTTAIDPDSYGDQEVLGTVTMDTDSISVISHQLHLLFATINKPGSCLYIDSVLRRTKINTSSKIKVKGKLRDRTPIDTLFAPRCRGQSRIRTYPLHWFSNIRFLSVSSGCDNITFHISLFLLDHDFIRDNNYLTDTQVAALNASLNAARTRFSLMPSFSNFPAEIQESLRARLLNTPKFQSNHGPMKDEYGNVMPKAVNSRWHLAEPYYEPFGELVQDALCNMTLDPPQWLCPYDSPFFHGMENPIAPRFDQWSLQTAAKVIVNNGVFVAQAVGVKELWGDQPSAVLRLNTDSDAMNIFLHKSFNGQVQRINDLFVDPLLAYRQMAVIYFDTAISVKPHEAGTSFLLNAEIAAIDCKAVCKQTYRETSSLTVSLLHENEPVVFPPQDHPPSYHYDAVNGAVDSPSIPGELISIPEITVPPRSTDPLDENAVAPATYYFEAVDEQVVSAIDAITDEDEDIDLQDTEADAISFSALRDEIDRSGCRVHSYYGTNGIIGNVQYGHPILFYTMAHDSDERLLTRGLNHFETVSACQIYMPASRFLLNKKNSKDVLKDLLGLSRHVKSLLILHSLNQHKTPQWRKAHTQCCHLVDSVGRLIQDMLYNWRIADRHTVRFEISFIIPDDPNVKIQWPITDGDMFTRSVHQASNRDMYKYLSLFIDEHLSPLKACFSCHHAGEHNPVDYSLLDPSMKTALVYHAESLMSFIEVAPDFEGSISRRLRRNCLGQKLSMKHVPQQYRLSLPPNTPPWSAIKYGIPPNLLPTTAEQLYDLSNVDGSVEFQKQFRFPVVYAAGTRAVRHIFQQYSLVCATPCIAGSTFGTMEPPNFQIIADSNVLTRKKFFQDLSDALLTLYDATYRRMINLYLRKRCTAGFRALFNSVAVLLALPTNVEDIQPYVAAGTFAFINNFRGAAHDEKRPIRTPGTLMSDRVHPNYAPATHPFPP